MKPVALLPLVLVLLGGVSHAQPAGNYDANGGEILFRNGKTKPYVEFRENFMAYFRAEDLDDFMVQYKSHHTGEERASKLPFAQILRVDFLQPTKDEMRLLKDADGCRDVNDRTICFVRKAAVLTSNGKKYENIFIYVDYTGDLYGPEDETYKLKELDIIGFTRNK